MLDQLIILTNAITSQNIDVEKVMEERLEQKYEFKLAEKISQEVALKKVKLSELVSTIEPIISEAIILIQKLCTLDQLTQEYTDQIEKIDFDLKSSVQSLTSNEESIKLHNEKIKQAQKYRQDIQFAEMKYKDEVNELQD